MDLSESVAMAMYPPTCAFLDIEKDCGDLLKGNETTGEFLPDCLELCVGAKIDSDDNSNATVEDRRGGWVIDGTASMGTQFFARPAGISSRLVPNRIDLFVQDQYKQSPELRRRLGSSTAFCVQDGRVARLPIAQIVCEALERLSSQDPRFFGKYLSMPFGSKLIIERVVETAEDVKIHLVPHYEPEKHMRTLQDLKSDWPVVKSWPESIDLTKLRLEKQVHDTISIVKIAGESGDRLFTFRSDTDKHKLYAFKSGTDKPKNIYHELWVLLQTPSHPNLVPKPPYIVTLKDRYGGPDKVCGFLLPYLSGGNLANALGEMGVSRSVDAALQLKWAKQIAQTLQFLHQTRAGFYSELKPDNILLSGRPGDEDVAFIDFEQRSNWMDFSAPEIHYAEFLKFLADEKNTKVPERERKKYKALYDRHVGPHTLKNDEPYGPGGVTVPWSWLETKEIEAAEVYSLGMVLYCIFERVPSNKNCMTKAFARDGPFVEFPAFALAPSKIRELIQWCTKGSNVDCVHAEYDVFRVGSRVWPRGKTGVGGEPVGTPFETLDACQRMWRQKLSDMERFYVAKERWEDGKDTDEDKKCLGFLNRPKLDEVLAVLDKFGEDMQES